MTKTKLFGAILLGSMLSVSTSYATEGIAPAGPIGGTDLNQALLPPVPGLYYGVVGAPLKLGDYRLDGGGKAKGDGHLGIGAVAGLIVYDHQLFGGQLASSIGVGYQRVCYQLGGTGKNCSEGVMDTYTDLLMWSKFMPSENFSKQPQGGRVIPYGTAVLLSMGATWPTGKYDKHKPINVGSNFYTFSPSVALTHTSPSIFGAAGHATQVSARLFYNHYTENQDSDYDSADTVSVDFSASEMFGNWTLGIAGTGWSQIADDKVHGDSNGIRGDAFSIGPIVQYDFSLGDRPAFIKLKYLKMTSGSATPQVDGPVLSFVTKF